MELRILLLDTSTVNRGHGDVTIKGTSNSRTLIIAGGSRNGASQKEENPSLTSDYLVRLMLSSGAMSSARTIKRSH